MCPDTKRVTTRHRRREQTSCQDRFSSIRPRHRTPPYRRKTNLAAPQHKVVSPSAAAATSEIVRQRTAYRTFERRLGPLHAEVFSRWHCRVRGGVLSLFTPRRGDLVSRVGRGFSLIVASRTRRTLGPPARADAVRRDAARGHTAHVPASFRRGRATAPRDARSARVEARRRAPRHGRDAAHARVAALAQRPLRRGAQRVDRAMRHERHVTGPTLGDTFDRDARR